MDSEGTLVHVEPPESFFFEKLGRALLEEKVRLTEDSEFHVVNLLSQHRLDERSPLLQLVCKTVGPGFALGPELLRAIDDRDARRIRMIGDCALLAGGMWWLTRYIHDPEYYLSLGIRAYGELDIAPRYNELARKFRKVAGALTTVSASCLAVNEVGLLRLIEKYDQTRNSALGRELARQGVFLASQRSQRPQ